MTRAFFALPLLFLGLLLAPLSPAQTPASENSELLALTKKIDEQNTKIDALSQQILKLQQTLEQGKPTPSPTTVGVASDENATATPVPAVGGNSHVVTRGETLTSIAKQHKVGIEELQKFNHIENDRKLQIGQTLAIPGPGNSAPSATPSPNE